jgi:hypothetical protein
MPWRLILSIVIFAIFLTFITFNLDNRCDVNLGFAKFTNVPVFITIFSSFVLGLLCGLPIAYRLKNKGPIFWKRKKGENKHDTASDGGSDESD